MADDNYPKGWNDPPTYSFDSHTNHLKRPSLNKRIAYIGGTMNSNYSAGIVEEDRKVNAPPLGPPPVATFQITPTSEPYYVNAQPIELKVLLNNFDSAIKGLFQNENEKEAFEIQRRLTLMEKMWNADKFPNDLKLKLGKISKALVENDLTACDNLQRSLMVDHTSLCSSWMAAIRQLINVKRPSCEKESLK